MPSEPLDAQKNPPKRTPSSAKKRGHFLTALDRSYLREGPEPKQKTRRIYRGKRIEQERRTYKVQYARVVREAMRDARGALEDLAFLARTMDPDWLYDLLTESHHLYPPTAEDYPEPLQRQTMTLTGRPEAPLEEVLHHAAKAFGWERWVKSDYREGHAVNTGRRGERRRRPPRRLHRTRPKRRRSLNRLRTVTPVGPGGVFAQYTYDADNRRVTRVFDLTPTPFNPTTVRYAYDGWMVLEEADQTGAWNRMYINGIRIDEVYAMRSPIQMKVNSPFCQGETGPMTPLECLTADIGRHVYFHQDAQMTVHALTNGVGDPIQYYMYQPYGAAVIFLPTAPATAATFPSTTWVMSSTAATLYQPYQYMGRPFDVETDWQNVRNRYYDPAAGRFVSQDPAGVWGDETNLGNPYALLGNNPLTGTDPYGLCRWWQAKCLAREAAEAVAAAAKAASDAAAAVAAAAVAATEAVIESVATAAEATVDASLAVADATVELAAEVTDATAESLQDAAAGVASMADDIAETVVEAVEATGDFVADVARVSFNIVLAPVALVVCGVQAGVQAVSGDSVGCGSGYCGNADSQMARGAKPDGLSELDSACWDHDKCIGPPISQGGTLAEDALDTVFNDSEEIEDCNKKLADRAELADCGDWLDLDAWGCRLYARPITSFYATGATTFSGE